MSSDPFRPLGKLCAVFLLLNFHLANARAGVEEDAVEANLKTREEIEMSFPRFAWNVEVAGDRISVVLTKELHPRRREFLSAPEVASQSREFAFRTYGGTPFSVIKNFAVTWNGKPVLIADDLYKDCFNPYLKPKVWPEDCDGTIWITAHENGKSVLIQMRGGTVGEPYTVWWIIRKDGRNLRFVDETKT